eukprot:CAMPEP_0113875086 /NCGR_PEP_ID=MMETSP0780_2-20120614/4727_1 /TAXON_ID=652834 /ORGANISM="Palpitomonas bilix" /LENGTH=843 /DNA_ID=CAMNT_0000860997 /DNA_START=91 /DNA_END=2623 /DNA_ORIENTATION=- /assembly_acc=CAM_ASM_000599
MAVQIALALNSAWSRAMELAELSMPSRFVRGGRGQRLCLLAAGICTVLFGFLFVHTRQVPSADSQYAKVRTFFALDNLSRHVEVQKGIQILDGGIDPASVPLLSVILPYTSPKREFLADVIQSIKTQTVAPLVEVIFLCAEVHAECSHDRLGLPPRFTIIKPRGRIGEEQLNISPLPVTRNIGFEAARAPFGFMLDSDDMMEPTTLEKTLWVMWSLNSSPVEGRNLRASARYQEPELLTSEKEKGGKGSRVGAPSASIVGGITVEYYPKLKTLFGEGSFQKREAFLRSNSITALNMYRSDVYFAVGGSDEEWDKGLEDWELYLRILAFGGWGFTIPEPLDWYRRFPRGGEKWSAFKKLEKGFVFEDRYGHLSNASFKDIAAPPPNSPLSPLCYSLGRSLSEFVPGMSLPQAGPNDLPIENRDWLSQCHRGLRDVKLNPTVPGMSLPQAGPKDLPMENRDWLSQCHRGLRDVKLNPTSFHSLLAAVVSHPLLSYSKKVEASLPPVGHPHAKRVLLLAPYFVSSRSRKKSLIDLTTWLRESGAETVTMALYRQLDGVATTWNAESVECDLLLESGWDIHVLPRLFMRTLDQLSYLLHLIYSRGITSVVVHRDQGGMAIIRLIVSLLRLRPALSERISFSWFQYAPLSTSFMERYFFAPDRTKENKQIGFLCRISDVKMGRVFSVSGRNDGLETGKDSRCLETLLSMDDREELPTTASLRDLYDLFLLEDGLSIFSEESKSTCTPQHYKPTQEKGPYGSSALDVKCPATLWPTNRGFDRVIIPGEAEGEVWNGNTLCRPPARQIELVAAKMEGAGNIVPMYMTRNTLFALSAEPKELCRTALMQEK